MEGTREFKGERVMTNTQKKQLAQDLILHQLSIIRYGNEYEEFVNQIGSQTEADKFLKQQTDKIAAWFA